MGSVDDRAVALRRLPRRPYVQHVPTAALRGPPPIDEPRPMLRDEEEFRIQVAAHETDHVQSGGFLHEPQAHPRPDSEGPHSYRLTGQANKLQVLSRCGRDRWTARLVDVPIGREVT